MVLAPRSPRQLVGYTPRFDNPYPQRAWQFITDFEYVTPLVLYRHIEAVQTRTHVGDAAYLVGAPYEVRFRLDGEPRRIVVPQGMATDLSSVPRLFRSLVERVGPHLEASIVHDFLYLAWQDIPGWGPRPDDWRFADHLMFRAMEAARVDIEQRTLMYQAVRSEIGWAVYRSANPEPRYWLLPA